eukprot:CAMPEP_0173426358 /NCGR_PEP_ID=MMETSP1357-20121228/5845_1 /TAXON_ID=77926 /ORGANISM="Hemiselmis rufescens, Strain PCC563" /LENGTH=293 /DNA_ID=CAMNT_0014390003 /DNA_START=177 /DNA_END=1055 /DNA_ORIENTATION=-
MRWPNSEKESWLSNLVAPPAVGLRIPRATLGTDSASIQLQRFLIGDSAIGKLAREVLDNETEVLLPPEETLLAHGAQHGVTISIGHRTKSVLHFDTSSCVATLDSAFGYKILNHSTYEVFKSRGGFAGGDTAVPTPNLSIHSHSVFRKKQHDERAEGREREKAKIVPLQTKAAQDASILADVDGPPGLRGVQALADAAQTTCKDYVDALVRFAERGSGPLDPTHQQKKEEEKERGKRRGILHAWDGSFRDKANTLDPLRTDRHQPLKPKDDGSGGRRERLLMAVCMSTQARLS